MVHPKKVPVRGGLSPIKVMLRPFHDLVLSTQFLTVLPLPAWPEADGQADSRRMAQASWTFPLVGLILGAILAAANWLMTRALPSEWTLPFGAISPSGARSPSGAALPSSVADLLTIGVLIWLTGGLHIDGLADTCDGLFSRRPRERVLEIMRDSRVGSFGVMGIVLDILARFVLLNSLGPAKLPALILVPVLSRWMMVLAARIHPYARAEGGLGKAFTEHIGAREVVLASITALLLAVALLRGTGLLIAGVVLLLTLGASKWIANKIGGMTGDTFGAVNELAEVGGLLALVLLRA